MTNMVENVTNVVAEAAQKSAGAVILDEFSRNKEVVSNLYQWLAQHGISFLVSLLLTAVIFLIGWGVIKCLTKAMEKVLKKSPLNELLTHFIVSVLNKTLWCLLLMIVLKRLGLDITPLIAGLGVTGFILGFAFKDALGNLASGMMIALNQPFKVGDYVNLGGNEGTVKSLNMMMTLLATADNKKVVVPNSVVWGSAITNFSETPYRRVDLTVAVAYKTDLAKACAIAREAVAKVPSVLPDPAPAISVGTLADSSVVLNIRPFAKPSDYWAVYSGVLQSVKEAFDQAGIEIPFRQLDVRVTQND
ncbi:MAG: mechanosensitive ion channel family protein [Kiritimatiellae bacterium]|nr:mechanosensitive ion channel family protein [Kiritimatiellia bacterium]